jgi:hypothetical protein
LSLDRRSHLQAVNDVAQRGRFDDKKFDHEKRVPQNLLLTAVTLRLMKFPSAKSNANRLNRDHRPAFHCSRA